MLWQSKEKYNVLFDFVTSYYTHNNERWENQIRANIFLINFETMRFCSDIILTKML